MKKCIYILSLLLLLLAPLHADIHRMGSYNIRVLSDKDTGDKAWTNRKEYVARIITGKEYDVIGIQEMKKVQYNDLKSLLPDYGLEYWGRDSHLLMWAKVWELPGVPAGIHCWIKDVSFFQRILRNL